MADVFFDGDSGPEIRRKLNNMWDTWEAALVEAVGWSPMLTVVSDGDRRVLRLDDWVGGGSDKPSLTGYLGPSGIVSNIAEAVDIRGPQGVKGDQGDVGPKGDQGDIGPKGDKGDKGDQGDIGPKGDKGDQGDVGPKGDQGDVGPKGDKGDQGDQGPKGDKGDKGDTGNAAWTPVYTAVADGERRVLRIDDWVDGQGTKPATGYLGVSGVVANIGDALDIRGAPGEGAVSSVNSIDPDGSGNVDLGISDIPGLEDALDNAGQVKTVAGKGPDGAGNVELGTSDITGLDDALANKVDKVTGYGLSQENYTLSEKQKLASLESSRWKGEFVSLGALQSAYPTAEPGDYADVDAGAGQNVRRYIWDDSDGEWVEQSGVVPPLTAAQVKTLYESNPDTNGFTNALKSKLENLATVATSGSYNDLNNRPSIPAAQVNSDWSASAGVAQILNKPTAMSQGEAETGTATTPRLLNAQVLKAAIEKHAGDPLPDPIEPNSVLGTNSVGGLVWIKSIITDHAPIGVVMQSPGGGGGYFSYVNEAGDPISRPPYSWFNDHPVFGGIVDVMIDGQHMVEIPSFHVRYGMVYGKPTRWMAKNAFDGSHLYPAFMKAGSPVDQIWVGKYQASMDGSKLASVPGVLPAVSRSLTQFIADAAARNVGGVDGFMLWSIYHWSAIQWLYLIEKATMDSQTATGMGRVSQSSAAIVDALDVAEATYRGVVGLWGNARQWMDGFKSDDGVISIWDRLGNESWVNTGQTRQAATGTIYPLTLMDQSAGTYQFSDLFVGDTGPASNSGATIPDYQNFNYSGERFPSVGGRWNNAAGAGLWCLDCNRASSNTETNLGARLAKV